MYAMTSYPLVKRTFATFRNAEFGFFGVRVITCTQTPRRCGQSASAGDFDFTTTFLRPFLTSWLIVGIKQNLLWSQIVRGLKKPLWQHNPLFSQTRGSVDYISFPIPRKRFFLKAVTGTPGKWERKITTDFESFIIKIAVGARGDAFETDTGIHFRSVLLSPLWRVIAGLTLVLPEESPNTERQHAP